MTTTRNMVLTGVNGDRINLVNDEDYELATTSTVHSGQSYVFTEKPLVGYDGNFTSGVEVKPKDVVLPIRVFSDSELDQDQKLQRLSEILGAHGECQLTHTRTDGTKRHLFVQYRGGFDSLIVAYGGKNHVLVNVTFRASNPFWLAHEEQPIETFNLGGSNDTTGAVWEFDVDGDVPEVWPRWHITGNANNIQIIDLSTGRFLRIKEVINNTQDIRIDTRPRNSGVWLNDVYLQSVVLDDASTFFPLRSGYNRLLVKGVGAAPAGVLTVRWQNRYFTP